MAWVEGKTWEIEQGVKASKRFRFWEDTEKTTRYPLTGWDINATLYDERGRTLYPCDVIVDASQGEFEISLPEATTSSLKPGNYLYDALGNPPGNLPGYFLAQGPSVVYLRKSRRDS